MPLLIEKYGDGIAVGVFVLFIFWLRFIAKRAYPDPYPHIPKPKVKYLGAAGGVRRVM